MSDLEYLSWMFELNFNIFKQSIVDVVGYFELGDKSFVKEEKSHGNMKIALVITEANGFINFSQGSISWVLNKILLKVGWFSKIYL